MVRKFFFALIAAISCSTADEFAYVANFNTNNVTIIDSTTNTTVATVTVGRSPSAIIVTPNGEFVYVANASDNTVSVINAITDTVISTIPVGSSPDALAITSDGASVFVADSGDNTVYRINTSSNTATLFATLPALSNPAAIAVNQNQIYVARTNLGQIEVFTTLGSSAGVINNGQKTFAIAAQNPSSSISSQSYAASGFSPGYVQVINGLTVFANVTVGASPDAIAVTPNGQDIYVANFSDNNVNVIETIFDTIIATIPVGAGPDGLAISPDGLFGYVANFTDNTVSVIDTNSSSPTYNTVILTLPVGGGPSGVATGIAPMSGPANLTGKQKKNDFGVMYELFNLLEWGPSSTAIAGFHVYRNGTLIATLGPDVFKYKDHDRKKGVADLYAVTTFDSSGHESSPKYVEIK